jgi:hypothetical protein
MRAHADERARRRGYQKGLVVRAHVGTHTHRAVRLTEALWPVSPTASRAQLDRAVGWR